MCTAKAPKQQEVKEKKVQYLSNPWIDGLGITGSQARGRNSLRSDAPRAPVNVLPPFQPGPPGTPVRGGSGGGAVPGQTVTNGDSIARTLLR